MSDSEQRTMFGLEFVLIVVPYALVIGVMVVSVVGPSLGLGMRDLTVPASMVAVALVPMVSGLRLSVAYLTGGSVRLLEVPKAWWWAAWTGLAVPVVGLIAYLARWAVGDFAIEPTAADPGMQPFGPARVADLTVGVIALPLLIPFAHLAVAYRRGMRSNNALEQTRDG